MSTWERNALSAVPARLRQILEVSKQLQEWQRAAKVVAA